MMTKHEITPADSPSFLLSTLELGRRAGASESVERTIDLSEAMGTAVMAVPAGSQVHLEASLESVEEGVFVSGTVRAQATGECVRCLDPVSFEIDVPFSELFFYSEHAHRGDEEEEDEETRILDGENADVESTVRDAIVLSLPFQPVCREDCPGLCPQCGDKLVDGPHEHESIDPRWSALQALSTEREES